MIFLFNIQTQFGSTLQAFVYWFSNLLGLLFFVLYFHQFIYLIVGTFKIARVKKKPDSEVKKHRFGIVLPARNEEQVISFLIDSIRKNDYPQELYDIIVIADNCTDNTAGLCRDLGCIVFERHNLEQVGKGYALNFLFENLHTDPKYADLNYDAYIVLDADNLLTRNYITEMNRVFDSGYDVVTSYRNTKNFGDNWISDGYGYWFLHEARHLNNPRMLFRTSCAISGTGFLVASDVIKEYDNWCFFFLTEDIQFSTQFALSKRKVGYAHDAMLYDEQPTSFKQAWRQRERWAKGFYQVFGSKAGTLVKKMWTNFSCWDILTTIFPAIFISLLMIIVYPICMVVGAITGDPAGVTMAGEGMGSMILALYAGIFVYGVGVLLTEWKNIKMPAWKKIWRNFTFPLFMFTYLPIAICAAFKKVEWKPIYHNALLSASDLGLDEEGHQINQRVELQTESNSQEQEEALSVTADTKTEAHPSKKKIKNQKSDALFSLDRVSKAKQKKKKTTKTKEAYKPLAKQKGKTTRTKVALKGSSVYAQSQSRHK